MGFLDKKEQVLEIILTKHGRKMLGKGKFSPRFYAFSDDEIDYQVPESQFSQLTASIITGPSTGILTEGGDFLITEAGDFIIQE